MVGGFSLSLQSVAHSSQWSDSISRQLTWRRSRNRIKRVGTRSSRIYASVHKYMENKRVFVLSDLHTDYTENMTWVRCISSTSHQEDILLVAGDVAETYDKFFSTMSLLTSRFKHVFFVPGNHDLWCRKEGEDFHDSLDKLNALLHACGELGVESSPLIIGDLGIIPLYSWYHESFDTEQDITGLSVPSLKMVCKDFHACRWSSELCDKNDSLAQYFDAMNEKHSYIIEEIQRKCEKVITFSHFVPRQDLCPEKRMLFYPNLPKIIGSSFLEARVRSIHGAEGSEAACHVFGHTHFGWDATLDGIRYVQAPLAYPRERKRRMNGGEDWLPFCLYSDGRFTDRRQFYWSDYYSVNSRNPGNLELAPWVANFYRRRLS
ncbi:hypothetical protein BVRB_8g190810 [Beta vulgaris subsp. vulgaris]|uniref:uncharacterized protein LOC104901659 isoform X1 n=1 Tax=Beta vulgaris subsp. vulgaris TaxID=3555 RepID=UPI0005401C18|nr:uncharacterized protein LOC104901659 isoform X1 [Beta vulgaris subsp. vulgaris]XP_019106800.1 uncharacterized protein LOC104901659 isoform X1 [Beta vulgaris subsp. vulgaris]KMT03393.1 hypothetical protein BVRB_8g190810 [Beta vulgaris subsp. vulgaris]